MLLDEKGLVMDGFPAHVSATVTSAASLDIFVIPDFVEPMDTATIQLNSIRPLPDNGRFDAHVIYPDGSLEIVSLTGYGTVRQGFFMVPHYVPSGVIIITIFDDQGTILGTTRAQVVEEDHHGGLVDIYLDNPDFRPSETVRIGVESGWPLNFVPRARLNYYGGSINLTLCVRIPGNGFGGELGAPRYPIELGRR